MDRETDWNVIISRLDNMMENIERILTQLNFLEKVYDDMIELLKSKDAMDSVVDHFTAKKGEVSEIVETIRNILSQYYSNIDKAKTRAKIEKKTAEL